MKSETDSGAQHDSSRLPGARAGRGSSLEMPGVERRRGRRVAIVGAVSFGLFYTTQSGGFLRFLFPVGSLPDVPYLRSAMAAASDVLVLVTLVCLAAWRPPGAALGLAGLAAPVRAPLRWSLWIFLPASLVAVAVAGGLASTTPADVIWKVLLGPFSEELVYRGVAVGALMRWCDWKLLPACLWPAIFFGGAHLWQGSDLASTVGVVAITAAGGLLFGWHFVRWGYNLWPAVLLHVGLNGLWTLFGLGDNAVGGWFGNVLRLLVVVAAIVTTLRLKPAPPVEMGEDALPGAEPPLASKSAGPS